LGKLQRMGYWGLEYIRLGEKNSPDIDKFKTIFTLSVVCLALVVLWVRSWRNSIGSSHVGHSISKTKRERHPHPRLIVMIPTPKQVSNVSLVENWRFYLPQQDRSGTGGAEMHAKSRGMRVTWPLHPEQSWRDSQNQQWGINFYSKMPQTKHFPCVFHPKNHRQRSDSLPGQVLY
jgi:hypothetical protein